MKTALKLGPTDHDRPLTWEEFITASYDEGCRYELINGRLYVSPAPNLPHDRLAEWLGFHLRLYARQHPEVINYISGHPRAFVPSPPTRVTAPEPDLAVFEAFPLNLPLAQVTWHDVSPILVVEVISEDDPDKNLVRNVDLYLRVPSIREYWILDPRPDPDQPTLLVYRRRGQRWQNRIEVAFGETYTTRLLPGFSLVMDPRHEHAVQRGGHAVDMLLEGQWNHTTGFTVDGMEPVDRSRSSRRA